MPSCSTSSSTGFSENKSNREVTKEAWEIGQLFISGGGVKQNQARKSFAAGCFSEACGL